MNWPFTFSSLPGALLLGGLLGFLPSSPATEPISREEDLRTALLISFVRFTEWPVSQQDSPLVIGVVNQPSLYESLQRLTMGKSVLGRPLVVRGVRYVTDLKQCNLIDFGNLEGKRLSELLSAAQELPLLTVGGSTKFLRSGGAIQIFQQDGRLSFAVELGVLEQIKLKVSSKLLRLGFTSKAAGKKRPGKPSK